MSFLGLFLFLLQAVAPQIPATAQQDLPVQMGFRVSPDTVLIGQPFSLFIKVLAPKGVRFEFPAGPDTASANGVHPVELSGEKVVTMLGDTALALYHLTAWDIGTQSLRFPDVRVTYGGQERRPSLAGASVFVKSVLPADTSLRVPKPARPIIVLPVFNWLRWLAIAAAVAALILGWWVWRRYRNRPKPPIDPYVRAQQEFARIETRRLIETGEPEEYVASMVDVTREYLAARVKGVRRSNTSGELLRTMQPRDGVESELPGLLDRADLVKFARGEVGEEDAKRAGTVLKAIVDHVEARVNPESEVAKRIAAAKGRAA
ncbi:MAG TPA: hypothetical protein VGN73_05375 [Gemmatimonadaceae bacterium]|nr:hypothetical protein [Gemmatimonadaceae bacterium]